MFKERTLIFGACLRREPSSFGEEESSSKISPLKIRGERGVMKERLLIFERLSEKLDYFDFGKARLLHKIWPESLTNGGHHST
jgi:hypothetical protein